MKSRPLCLGCGVFLGVLILLLNAVPLTIPDYSDLEGTSVTICGYVDDLYYKSNSYQIVLSKIDDDSANDFKVIVSLSDGSYLPKIGSKIKVKGILSQFVEARNEGQFSLRDYYHIRKIEYSLKKATIITASLKYDRLGNTLHQVKIRLSKSLEQIASEKESGILRAVLLGDKTGLYDDVKQLYQDSGLSHALAISGLHISMLGMFLYKGLQKLSLNRVISGILTALFLILYGIMCADALSFIRAVIMFILTILAELTGRAVDLLTSLSVALLLSLMTNPLNIYDSGFLLSYSAVIAIAVIYPHLYYQYENIFKFKILQSLLLSLSITVLTFPITLYFFYQYPLYSVFLNFVLIPFMPIIVCLGFISMIMGAFFTYPAKLIMMIVKLLLAFYEKSMEISQKLPGSVFIAGRPDKIQILIYYLIILFVITCLKRKRLLTFIAIFLAMFICTIHIRSGLTIKVIDVGQGNCVYLGTKTADILCDGGSSDVSKVSQYRILPVLKSMGVKKLDAVFISHMDLDHISGIKELIESSSNSTIKINKVFFTGNSLAAEAGQELYRTCAEKNIEVYEAGAGDSISYGKLMISVLYPERRKRGDENELSMVLDVRYGEFCALLPGDLENDGEKNALKYILGKYNCYIVAHHGSKGGSSEALLSKIRPDVAIISCGVNNTYGHPHAETLKRLEKVGSKIYISSETGAVTIKTGRESFNIDTFFKSNGG